MGSSVRDASRIRGLVLSLAALCLLALAASPSALAAQSCQSATATPAQAGKRAAVRATLCSLNSERASNGLAPLRLNRRLSRAATAHARDMTARKYFSHDTLGGGSFVDRIRRAGYLNGARSWTVGENIAWGALRRSTPLTITRMWMGSPPHRANVLNPSFREIGIGVANGAPVAGMDAPAATYATEFGTRR